MPFLAIKSENWKSKTDEKYYRDKLILDTLTDTALNIRKSDSVHYIRRIES